MRQFRTHSVARIASLGQVWYAQTGFRVFGPGRAARVGQAKTMQHYDQQQQ